MAGPQINPKAPPPGARTVAAARVAQSQRTQFSSPQGKSTQTDKTSPVPPVRRTQEEILEEILLYLKPPDYPRFYPVTLGNDLRWYALTRLDSDVVTWTIHNMSAVAMYYAYESAPAAWMWGRIPGWGHASQDTRPIWIYVRRESIAAGGTPTVVLETWSHKEVYGRYGEKTQTTLQQQGGGFVARAAVSQGLVDPETGLIGTSADYIARKRGTK